MVTERPYVMSIAGFDPSAGAGILADIKCFEQLDVYGFGVCSALTVQTDSHFIKNEWLETSQIIAQLKPLLASFQVSACKIGLIKDVPALLEVVSFLKAENPDLKIVVDPVLKASSGYGFHDWANGLNLLKPVLEKITLITPNYLEMQSLGGDENVTDSASKWAQYCAVLLKGGHNTAAPGTDYLYDQTTVKALKPLHTGVHQKHGSGCVLSAAIVAQLAKGNSLPEACKQAKTYTEHFLNSNKTLLGYHKL